MLKNISPSSKAQYTNMAGITQSESTMHHPGTYICAILDQRSTIKLARSVLSPQALLNRPQFDATIAALIQNHGGGQCKISMST